MMWLSKSKKAQQLLIIFIQVFLIIFKFSQITQEQTRKQVIRVEIKISSIKLAILNWQYFLILNYNQNQSPKSLIKHKSITIKVIRKITKPIHLTYFISLGPKQLFFISIPLKNTVIKVGQRSYSKLECLSYFQYSLLILNSKTMKNLQKKSYYQVQQILDKKVDEKGVIVYLVKWKNWPSQSNTWEPYKNLTTVKNLIQQFQNKSRPETKQQNNHEHLPHNQIQQQIDNNFTYPTMKVETKNTVTNATIKRKPGRPFKIKKEEDQSQKLFIVNGSKKSIRIHQLKSQQKQTKTAQRILLENAQLNRQLRKAKTNKKRRRIYKAQKKERKKMRAVEQSLENIHIASDGQNNNQEDEDSIEQLGLEQVLLKCQSYKYVKTSFRQKKFYYQIPYFSNGQKHTFKTTASEITKVNPRWLQGYFEGFYL